MDTSTTERRPNRDTAEFIEDRERDSARLMMSSWIVQAAFGVAALILSILGLAGLSPLYIAGIAMIVVGFGLLTGSGAAFKRMSSLLHYADTRSVASFGAGMNVEYVVGVVGVVLGILALLEVAPVTLLSAATILFGLGLLFSGAALMRMEAMIWSHAHRHGFSQGNRPDSVSVSAAVQCVIGAGVIVLGILACIESVPLPFILIAAMALGCASILSGSSVSSRMHALATH